MYQFKRTDTFQDWWVRLKDERAKTAILSRLNRLTYGLAGDAKPVGEGVSELRVHYGPGYRVYFQRQARDIRTAKRLAKELES